MLTVHMMHAIKLIVLDRSDIMDDTEEESGFSDALLEVHEESDGDQVVDGK